MKSLFSRFRNKGEGQTSRPASSASHRKHVDSSLSQRPSSSYDTASSNEDYRTSTPIHELHSHTSTSSLSTQPTSAVGSDDDLDDESPQVNEEEDTIRIRDVMGQETIGAKKVTFRSPIPKQLPSGPLAGPSAPSSPTRNGPREVSQASRTDRAASPAAKLPFLNSQRSASAQSRPFTRHSLPALSNPLRRKPSLGSSSRAPSPTKSIMSPVSTTASERPYSRASTQSYLPPPNSWSEMAEDDLIANLSPRERTRQEVLWEIVSSEER